MIPLSRSEFLSLKLSEPDKKLVSRILEEVSFDERIVSYRMHQHLGLTKATMYSFEEVVNFLNDTFPLLKFEELEKWARAIMKDKELAMKIAEAVEVEHNDHDRTQRIKILMGQRLNQCKSAKIS